MSKLTEFLKLFKYDPVDDGMLTFNITTALNDNWDKLDDWGKSMSAAVVHIAMEDIQIPATDWTTSASGDYTVYKDITVSGMTTNDLVILTPSVSSLDTAKKAGIGCEAMAGKLRIRARKTPTATISATYHIIQGGT